MRGVLSRPALADVGRGGQIAPPVPSPHTLARIALAGLCLLAAPLSAAAQDTDESSGLVGLSLPVGARIVGQGRAASAGSAELQALPYNPAAIFGLDSRAVTYSRFQAASDTEVNGNYVAAGLPARWGTVAVHAVYIDYGSIPITDTSPEPIGSLDVSDWAVGATWTNRWREKLAYGVTAKWLHVDLGTVSAGGPAVDAGVVYAPRPSLPLSLALAVRNVGPDLDFGDGPEGERTERLASRVRLGVDYHPAVFPGLPPEYRLSLRFDIESVMQELATSSQHAGAAVTIHDVVVVRGGLVLLDNPFSSGSTENRSAGGSVGLGVRLGAFEADVAREMSVSELGAETHISASYRF